MEIKMKQYKDLITKVHDEGDDVKYRNGYRRTLIGETLRFDLRDGFPVPTIKETNYKAAFAEMLWFLSGSTNTKALKEIYPTKIWDKWANVVGSIGPMYGRLLRSYPTPTAFNIGHSEVLSGPDSLHIAPDMRGRVTEDWNNSSVDQLWRLLTDVSNSAYTDNSTRFRMTTYHPGFAPLDNTVPSENPPEKGCLTPCHGLAICVHTVGKVMHLTMTQGSCDLLLGGPYNISEYAFLLKVLARQTGYDAGELIIHFTNVHIYENQIRKLNISGLMDREPLSSPHR